MERARSVERWELTVSGHHAGIAGHCTTPGVEEAGRVAGCEARRKAWRKARRKAWRKAWRKTWRKTWRVARHRAPPGAGEARGVAGREPALRTGLGRAIRWTVSVRIEHLFTHLLRTSHHLIVGSDSRQRHSPDKHRRRPCDAPRIRLQLIDSRGSQISPMDRFAVL